MYKKHGITRKAVRTRKFAHPDRSEEIKDVINFNMKEMKSHIKNDVPIYYLDECMFTV